MKRNKLKSALIISNIGQILTNAKKRAKFTCCISPTGCYYYSGDVKLSVKEMDLLLPIEPKRISTKGKLIDHRVKHIYL